MKHRARSARTNGRFGWVFGGAFFLLGAAFAAVMFIMPLVKVVGSSGWSRVPCVVTQSGLKTSSGSKSQQYRLDIHYRYKVGPREYTGNRYNFATGTSNLTGWRSAIVAQYPVGKATECLVNPADPRDAVLSRAMGGDLWFALIPGVFVLVGAGVMIAARRAKTHSPVVPTAMVAGASGTVFTHTTSGPTELRAESTPMGKFIIAMIFALIWNAIIWGILLKGEPPIGVRIFLSIFVLIGTAIAWAAVTQFLALFNPRPTLRASTGAVRLGESVLLDWRFSGNVRRITQLTLTLQATEHATYRRGTDTKTDTSIFVQQKVFESSDAAAMASGQVSIAIPADSIHSLDAPNNKIIWTLRIHGTIARWPDVDLEFPLTVLPHATTTTL